MSTHLRFAVLISLISASLDAGTLLAQDTHLLSPPNTATPRETLHSFRESGRRTYEFIVKHEGKRSEFAGDFRVESLQILKCLDLSETPEYLRKATARRSAVCLLEVFDRIELPDEKDIPFTPPDADESDELDFTPPVQWRIPNTEIVLRRVNEGPREGEYLFSPDTVARAPEFYDRVKHMPYKPDASEGFYEWFLAEPGAAWLSAIVRRSPSWTRDRFWGQAVWQWIGLCLIVVSGLAVMVAAYLQGRRRARALEGGSALRRLLTLWAPVTALFVPLVVGWVISDILVITGGALAVMKFCTDVTFLMAIVALVYSLGTRIADLLVASPNVHPRGIDAQFIRITCRVVSLVVAVVVFLEGGQHLGIPLTTLLAGAGVGGLTVALAAQDTLRNLFGSLMILLDKPFRVGERIVVKGYDGVVQEIGLRSTKLRLLTGHEATIPNDELARSDVENVGRRLHIRRVTSLALPIDLSPEKCEEAVGIVRDLLANHEGFDEAYPPRVYLNEFNRDSLNLRFFIWYHPPDYWDFMAYSERLNLDIKRKFAEAGIPFALPTAKTIFAQQSDELPDVT